MTTETYPMSDALTSAWEGITSDLLWAAISATATDIALHLAIAHPERVAAIVTILDSEKLSNDEAGNPTPAESQHLAEAVYGHLAPLLPVAATEAGA